MNEICFLTASRGNAFMTELLRTVAEAVAAEGVDVSFEVDHYPAQGRCRVRGDTP